MGRFKYKVVLFLMPLIILGGLMELMLRQMPNIYRFKRGYLDANSNKIEVLFLGNSHSFFDLNPDYITKKCFNASHVSQSLDYDLEILKKYERKWSDLEYIVLPVSYFSLFEKLSVSKESWRVKDYCLYYKIKTSKYLPNYTEVLNGQLPINFRRLWLYYIKKADNISCTELGWGTSYRIKKPLLNLFEAGKYAAQRHRVPDDKHFEEMCSILDSIIVFAEKYDVELLLFTPPAFESYRNNLNEDQLHRTIQAATSKANKYDNCTYYNLLDDKYFTEFDFYDADHLNETGARELTLKIDSIINNEHVNMNENK